MSQVSIDELRELAAMWDDSPWERLPEVLRAAADELALARAVVEAAGVCTKFHAGSDKPGFSTLISALAAYRAHVGGTGK